MGRGTTEQNIREREEITKPNKNLKPKLQLQK